MVVSITGNTSAVYAQAGINARNEEISKGTQRLSSGLRVFSAGEDASALAIGTGLKIENVGLRTAALNASAGSSMLQIADGALTQVNDALVRMNALAQQASSGQLDDATRVLVDNEFQQLLTEINRIASSTQFNGTRMLAGTKNFDVTAASSLSALGISAERFDQTIVTGDRTYRTTYNATTEALTLTRIDAGAAVAQTIDLTTLLDTLAGLGQNLDTGQTLDVGFSTLGVTLTLDSSFNRAAAITPGGAVTTGPDMTIATPGLGIPTTGVSLPTVAGLNALLTGYDTTTGKLTLALDNDGAAIRLGARAGISYKVNAGGQGVSGVASADIVGPSNTVQIFVDIAGGGSELVGTFTTGAVATTGVTAGSLVLDVGLGMMAADYVDDNAATRLTYKVGNGIENGLDLINVDVPAATSDALGLTGASVTTRTNANNAIDSIVLALGTLGSARANVGAQQLRLEQVARSLGVVTENNEAARSALLDTDVAKEITDITSNRAMLEASVQMLSQANRFPDLILQLLRN